MTVSHLLFFPHATTKNKQLCDGLNTLILRFRDMWPLSCAITDMVHGVPYLYPIYTLSIPYLYFHWIFLIFAHPIYTLSILPLDFLDFLPTLSIPYLYFHWIFLIFCSPYLYPIYTLSVPYLYLSTAYL